MKQSRIGAPRQLITEVVGSAPATKKQSINYDGCQGLARALFEESETALILFDSKTQRILDANAATQRLCGKGLRDLLDLPVFSLFRWVRRSVGESWPHFGHKTRLPFDEWGCQLETVQPDVRVSVDVTLTRLAVTPNQINLLSLHVCAVADETDFIDATGPLVGID